MKYYEVYAVSIHGSDILEFDTLVEAKKEARKWSKDCDCDVVIHKVENTCVKVYKNGKEKKLCKK